MRRKMSKDFSGRFLVRIPVALHRTLAEQALVDRISLNQYILYVLAQGAGSREFERFLKSVKNTVVEEIDSIIESDKLAETPKVKLRLIGLMMQNVAIEKPSGKLYLDGPLNLEVDEEQEVLKIEGSNITVNTAFKATLTAKETGEEICVKANFIADYQSLRPLSRELIKALGKVRLASYPRHLFRELIERLVTNLNLYLKIS